MRGRLLRPLVGVIAILAVSATPVFGQELGGPSRDVLLDELGRGRVAFHDGTGRLRFAGGTAARPSAPSARLGGPANARAAARAYLARYGGLFGVSEPGRELVVERTTHAGGREFVRFRQAVGGVPVLGGELTVQADGRGNVVAAWGEASPDSDVDLDPAVGAEAARSAAVAAVARRHGVPAGALSSTPPSLAIYDPALLGPSALPLTRLVWRVEVSDIERAIDEFVLIDADSGVVALRFSQLAHARNRSVCDAGRADAHYPCVSPVRTESAGTSTVAAVNNAFDYMGDTYDFFQARFGRDSLDGAGAPLIATVRYCDGVCSQPNAFWDGAQAVFWPGIAADDVVAHELTHGFTDHTSKLFYYFQSGAINEALSDIFGEFVDLTNSAGTDTAEKRWLLGEDTSVGTIRDLKHPPNRNQPDRMRSSLYVADPSLSDNGGVHTNSGVANKAAYLMVDGGAFNGQTVSPIGLDKAAAVWYRVAVVHLSSGSDYEDLGLALEQACTDMIGLSVSDATGSVAATIAAPDCAAISTAVAATEMSIQPTTPGAAAPEAPICTDGTPSGVFADSVSEGHPGWIASNSRWTYDSTYATSNPWHLSGLTPPVAGAGSITTTTGIVIPEQAFLHFRHAHFFDHDSEGRYDGGVVEYQVGSASWTDARPLFTHNGYNGTITGYSGGGNPLAGRRAFTAYTWGYISSRVDLSTLAGSTIRFRFRTGTDSAVEDYGWVIDDIRIYTCSGGHTGAPTVTPPAANLRKGVAVGTTSKPIKVNVSFTATDPDGLSQTRLERRANTGTYSNVTLPSPSATSVNLAMPTSGTTLRQFRARATDTNGNVSPWAKADPFRVLAHQNGSAAVTQTGTWTTASNSNFYGGSVRHSSTAGAKVSRSSTVSDYAIVTTTGPNRGKADVYVDGLYRDTIDLYSATTRYRRVVYAVDFGASGSHTIELRVTGTKNASSTGTRVDFDAFLALAP